jgi:hypothetical protein
MEHMYKLKRNGINSTSRVAWKEALVTRQATIFEYGHVRSWIVDSTL